MYSYYRTESLEPSGVNDTHNGQFRIAFRANQVLPVAKGLQQVSRLDWDQQEAHSVLDTMESIRP